MMRLGRFLMFSMFFILMSHSIKTLGNASMSESSSTNGDWVLKSECLTLSNFDDPTNTDFLREIGRSMSRDEIISLFECLSRLASMPEESFDQFSFYSAPFCIASNLYFKDDELLFCVIYRAKENVESYFDENMKQLSLRFNSERIGDMVLYKKYLLFRNILSYSINYCVEENNHSTFRKLFKFGSHSMFVDLRNAMIAKIETAANSGLISRDHNEYWLGELTRMLLAEEKWLESSPSDSGNFVYNRQRSYYLIKRIMVLIDQLSE